MTIEASEFKAKCLSIIDEVDETGESVVISKRGRPVVRLVKFVDTQADYAQLDLRGSVRVAGDLIAPV
ncbi:MAG: type II toxin-antitoxin system Phd/YefM family antitoxin [Spirochaetaceae bacterium]|nr:MAG: type II toxin-antitoxin system Phd/YefM family antitoxin [Spirochaetaceae bacterium]